MADLLQPLRELGAEVSIRLSWARRCIKCNRVWCHEVEAPTVEEALQQALAIERANDVDPEMAKLCREAQEDGRRE